MSEKVLTDWLNDIKELEMEFDKKHRFYNILGHTLFITNIVLISANTLASNYTREVVYSPINTFLNFVSVTLMSVRKYINPEGTYQKYKLAYLRAKNLEDTIEASTFNPQQDYTTFIKQIKDEKESILKEFY